MTEKSRAFTQAIQTAPAPNPDWPPAVQALWWAGKGEWDRAHALVARASGGAEAWVHAHLHRLEGDHANAAYWYRAAGKTICEASLEHEFETLVEALVEA
ncbi:MAG: hypothetical protein SNJ84_04605 [Verrucomicrobiia bacterium]